MNITEITRRNIIDDVKSSKISVYGRFSEIEFLSRLYQLEELPSYDPRYKDMLSDIRQHTINNDDWDSNWIYEDDRLELLEGDDQIFLKFICETIHPIVRNRKEEVETLIKIYNQNLEGDGYEIFQTDRISGKPIYSARLISTPVKFENAMKFDSQFVKEQNSKCEGKLREGDYDGAITSARSLVEGVLGEIHYKCSGSELPKSGDLLKDYKAVKDLLNLSEDLHVHAGLKSLVRSFHGIIQSIDSLSNKMGDRHRPILKPTYHHAKLVVDSARTMSDFLYSSMVYQKNRRNVFVNELLTELDSDKRFLDREELINDEKIKPILDSSDFNLKTLTKNEFLNHYEVNSYRNSDIYFAVMRIFLFELTAEDLIKIYIESNTNNQMCGWDGLSEDLMKYRPELLKLAMKQVYQ